MTFDAPGPFGIAWGHFALLVAAASAAFGLVYAFYRRRDGLRRFHLVLVALAMVLPVFAYVAMARDVTVSDGPGNPRPACLFGYDEPREIDWGDECGRALGERLVVVLVPSGVILTCLVGGVIATVRRRSGSRDTASGPRF